MLVGEPVVDQAKLALVEVVLDGGLLEMVTVGAAPVGAVTVHEYAAEPLP